MIASGQDIELIIVQMGREREREERKIREDCIIQSIYIYTMITLLYSFSYYNFIFPVCLFLGSDWQLRWSGTHTKRQCLETVSQGLSNFVNVYLNVYQQEVIWKCSLNMNLKCKFAI